MSQRPQYRGSLIKDTHSPLQEPCPEPQGLLHMPCSHSSPAPQTVGHCPQWLTSVARFTHVPLQSVNGAAQSTSPEPQPTLSTSKATQAEILAVQRLALGHEKTVTVGIQLLSLA
jgi:hypothetical protein